VGGLSSGGVRGGAGVDVVCAASVGGCRIILGAAMMAFVGEKLMMPLVVDTIEDLSRYHFLNVIEKLLRLSIPNTYMWLCFFYVSATPATEASLTEVDPRSGWVYRSIDWMGLMCRRPERACLWLTDVCDRPVFRCTST
jgi:hypothetical protein